MSSRRIIKILTHLVAKKNFQNWQREQLDISLLWRQFLTESISNVSTHAAIWQDQLSSLATALFSVGFFQRRFGNYCPTSTWWTGSGTHSSGKHSSSWQAATAVGGTAAVTPAWQSMLRTESLTPSQVCFHPSQLYPLCLSYFASSSFSCPFPVFDGGGEKKRIAIRKNNSKASLHFRPCSEYGSLSSFSPSLHPGSGMSWLCSRCACRTQSAKSIDPLKCSFQATGMHRHHFLRIYTST